MLLVHARRDPRSRYSPYLAEILVMEGFGRVPSIDLDDLDDRALADAGLVILPRVALTAAEATRLVDFVAAGGKLLALQPDPYLGGRFGLQPTHRATAVGAGYLWIDQDNPATAGLPAEAVQTVVPAVAWRPSGTSLDLLARVHDATNPASALPGVVRVAHGRGEAILVAYDLAQTVARLRQGDPAYADLGVTGIDAFIRPHELFAHQLPPHRFPVPQADLQTALLARLIEELAPRPRVWYYPEADERSVMVMTSDDDWSTLEQWETLLAGLERRQATCTFYVVKDTRISPALISDWERHGHTFSVHPAMEGDYRAGPPVDAAQPTFVAEMVRRNVERHVREFDRPVRTMRNHAIRWLGYVDMARVYADLGARLECNYVPVNPYFAGHLCGSGRPLRFVDLDGGLIDCFQQPTHWTEEVLIHPGHGAGAHWQVEPAVRETTALIQAAARTWYTPICINSHPVSFATYSSPLIEADWDAALAEGMRIISADHWLEWTETREQVALTSRRDGWDLAAAAALPAATVLLPVGSAPAAGAERSEQVLWGRTYTAVTLRDLAAGEQRQVAGAAS